MRVSIGDGGQGARERILVQMGGDERSKAIIPLRKSIGLVATMIRTRLDRIIMGWPPMRKRPRQSDPPTRPLSDGLNYAAKV